MPRTIAEKGQTENLWDLARAAHEGEDIIIESNGERIAAIVDMGKYEQWLNGRERVFETIAAIQARNVDADPEEVERDVMEAIREVREEAYREAGLR